MNGKQRDEARLSMSFEFLLVGIFKNSTQKSVNLRKINSSQSTIEMKRKTRNSGQNVPTGLQTLVAARQDLVWCSGI
jgi:hypothetical protein